MSKLTATLRDKAGHSWRVKAKIDLLWWQERGLTYTSTGYGKNIPTAYKVYAYGRWLRVYCCIYSNSGTRYVRSNGQEYYIDIDIDID